MIRTETIEREGRSIAAVLLDRPEKRNALTPGMLEALCEALVQAPKSHDAVVLGGEGKLFCAGFDLSLCKDDPSGGVMRQLLTGLSRACAIMRRTEKPVVIAAHGAAIAGGCALLGGGDVVVSDASAKLGYPVTKIGVSPAVSAPFLSYNVTTGKEKRHPSPTRPPTDSTNATATPHAVGVAAAAFLRMSLLPQAALVHMGRWGIILVLL